MASNLHSASTQLPFRGNPRFVFFFLINVRSACVACFYPVSPTKKSFYGNIVEGLRCFLLRNTIQGQLKFTVCKQLNIECKFVMQKCYSVVPNGNRGFSERCSHTENKNHFLASGGKFVDHYCSFFFKSGPIIY